MLLDPGKRTCDCIVFQFWSLLSKTLMDEGFRVTSVAEGDKIALKCIHPGLSAVVPEVVIGASLPDSPSESGLVNLDLCIVKGEEVFAPFMKTVVESLRAEHSHLYKIEVNSVPIAA